MNLLFAAGEISETLGCHVCTGSEAEQKWAGLTSGPVSSRRGPQDGSWAATDCSLSVLRMTH